MGLRTWRATMIEQITDNRELQAALDPIDGDEWRGAYNYRDRDTLWLDYAADVGDGWDATWTLANAMSKQELDTPNETLARGDVLVLGGDEVYPDASAHNYQERLIEPFNAASTAAGANMEGGSADLFALPGNHDWYDGLRAFTQRFCAPATVGSEDKQIGTWTPRQRRSYFALALPHGWWLAAFDTQLDAGFNPTQLRYFETIATHCMKPGDRIVLCSSSPTWIADSNTDLVRQFANLVAAHGATVAIVLSGDLHHYNRYAATDGTMFVTAGAGSAFLHPTHKLAETLSIPPGERSAPDEAACELARQMVYPDAKTSRRLSARLFAFPLLNFEFVAMIGLAYTLLAWFMEARSHLTGEPVSGSLTRLVSGEQSLVDVMRDFFLQVPQSPEFALVVIAMYVGFIRFNMSNRSGLSIALGVCHAMAHFVPFFAAYCVAATMALHVHPTVVDNGAAFSIFVAIMWAMSSLFGGFVFGAYLWVALNTFSLQWTNSFSAIRVDDYRCFLRMHVADDGSLTVYPLKIDRVERAGRQASKPMLIEKPLVFAALSTFARGGGRSSQSTRRSSDAPHADERD